METLKSDSNIFVIILILCPSLFIPASCQVGHLRSHKDEHVALFIFGDSIFDVGNNNYLKSSVGKGNFPPYGETYFKHPTGRFSDGRVIPDFIAEFLKLPLIPPYLQPGNHQFTDGANFASGGAGALVETNQGKVINLKTQLNYFNNVEKQLRQELGAAEAKTFLSKAIYLFNIGINDYAAPSLTPNSTVFQSYSKEEYVGMVIGNLTTVIKGIYNNGGRKFGVTNLLPLGCLPVFRAQNQNSNISCTQAEVTVLARLHNKALSKVLEELKKELKGFNYSEFDFYTTLIEIMTDPSKYGYKDVEGACCGTGLYRGENPRCGTTKDYELCNDPSEYFFFDNVHPSEKANNQCARQFWSGSAKLSRPYNLKTLLQI